MYGPTKDLSILSYESFFNKTGSIPCLGELGFASFAITKHPETNVEVLAAWSSDTSRISLFALQAQEAVELEPQFVNEDEAVIQTFSSEITLKSFKIIEGDWLAVLILSDGTIFRGSVDPFSHQTPITFEQVGAVEGGISAATWSPDTSILVLVTENGKRILLSRQFDPIEEGPVQVESFGSEEMISIGWGRKETQFHGSAGKSAALAISNVMMKPVAESEDSVSRISWRADGNYFAISTIDEKSGRRIRVYDKTGTLCSTSEPIEGLECPLAWRPNGSLIASAQYLSAQNCRQVIFFERNGLRHGEFVLPRSDRPVKNLFWSECSEVLAIAYDDGCVELWTTANYHWYLKMTLPVNAAASVLKWNEESLKLLVIDTCGQAHHFHLLWDQHVCGPCFGVIDGKSIHLTPLDICNIPPPFSLLQLDGLEEVPSCYGINYPEKHSAVVAIGYRSKVVLYSVKMSAHRRDCSFEIIKSFGLEEDSCLIQIKPSGTDSFTACTLDGGRIYLISLDAILEISTDAPCWKVLEGGRVVLKNGLFGGVNRAEGCIDFIDSISNLSQWMEVLDENLILQMNDKGWLWVNDSLVMTQATSYSVSLDFILITTHSHQLIFLPRSATVEVWQELARRAIESQSKNEELQRSIERGSLLLTSVPESASVVLQLPRGNLETINPRAMVLSVLRTYLNSLDYQQAYALCRRHRLDLNILHDHAPELFLQTIGKFVNDLHSVDYLNIFLSALRDEDVSKTKYAGFSTATTATGSKSSVALADEQEFKDKVNSVSEAILRVLKEDSRTWIDSIMTVYVVQQPPRLEDALQSLLEFSALPSISQDSVEKSLKYLLFLVPAERLFEIALGIYQLPLALSIGRRSQMDPKDFESFLEELADLPESRRHFRINDHLHRFAKALNCLHEDADVADEQFLAYLQKYSLYCEAVVMTSASSVRYLKVLNLFGEHLMTSGDFAGAVCLFLRAQNWEKMKIAAVSAGAWREFLMASAEFPEAALVDGMLATLKLQGKFREAVQFAAKLKPSEVEALAVEGGLWQEALQATSNSQPILDALDAHGQQLLTKIQEMQISFNDKSERILRLQKRFLNEGLPSQLIPGGRNVGNNAAGDDNVSEMSFRTSNSTIKTRTTTSSRRSSKRTERIRLRDKPGSPHEREFLLFALRDLLAQVHGIKGEVRETLISLSSFSQDSALKLPRAIHLAFEMVCQSIRTFVDEFRKLQVPKICHFNALTREPIDDLGNIVENPVIDALDAKFELPADFGMNWSMQLF